jgi:phosphoglycerol transferase MdoB-like AlkP superfamily enzyme
VAILQEYGFESEADAINVLYDVRSDSTDNRNIEDVMYEMTPKEVVAKGYNVLFIIMESWSNCLMDYETYLGSDLMCGLNKHFSEDYLFRNFVSATNGTIDAVETFTINAQHPRIFTSSYRTYQYPTATAKVWHDAGYETSFLSGIEISWRNLMEVLPKQNFDRVIGKYELLNERPEAECNTTWGVYDHELFSYLNDYINTDGAPKFVMALTSTSHTPFEFPTSFALPEIAADKLSSDNFATSEDITLEYLKGYQYENMALSRFLDNFKVSEAADSTVVVITGDHNIRQILSYRNEEPWQKYSVPLYIYLPEQLRERVSYDPSRYGSHYDIVPTLATLTVPDGTYFNTGHNLLDTAKTYPWHGVNREVVIAPPTADKTQIERIVGARKALTKIYFQRLWMTK